MPKPDPLEAYNSRRDFSRTREPEGKAARRTSDKTSGDRFVVQKHAASRLHFDFRLEMDGVLKSWAVTRGPSADPADKRLAVRTEDHPVSYAGFEGVIPQGEYGGGTVMLWDEGTWEPIAGKSAAEGLKEGHLHFILHGARMKGEWILIRLKPRGKEMRENWLLRKVEDAYAGGAEDLTGQELTSIHSGRTMAAIADDTPPVSLKGKKGAAFDAAMRRAERIAKPAPRARVKSARRKGTVGKLPAFRALQLATAVDAVPKGAGWMHEIKYDGYRCLIAVAGPDVKIHSRSGLDWTHRFGSIATELAGLDLPPALIDGEIVALDNDGNPDFSLLQQRLDADDGGTLDLFAFDLLELDGEDMTGDANITRKDRLAALLKDVPETGHVHVADHLTGAGATLFGTICNMEQEGILSKRADAPYRAGRTHNWLKVKCVNRQEFVVVGWTRSTAAGRRVRNLLLAQHDAEDRLAYAGKVGTGFNAGNTDSLMDALARLETKRPVAEVPRVEAREAEWVKPSLVAEVAFAERTAGGRVRHARFLGLRQDKPAREVRPETNMPSTRTGQPPFEISHRDRVIFPEANVTKGALADYYAAMGEAMLPWLARRPVSLVRCPQGTSGHCFFQKHDKGGFSSAVHHVPIREKDGGEGDYLYVEDLEGIEACVQMGTIEFHGWGSTIDDLERPDRMVFDLDPDEGLDFADVRRAAIDLRENLADIGLISFAMLSGGKGVHVVVPLRPSAEWPEVKDFASRFAHALSENAPDRYIATMSKAKRKGRIFIDWLRNQRGSTSVLPYVVRARPGAPVATPVSWRELEEAPSAQMFTLADEQELVERATGKKLRDWGKAEQDLPKV